MRWWLKATTAYLTPSGQSYGWSYTPRTRNSPPRSQLSIDAKLPADFRVVEECWFHRFAKWMGFASEFQTGDDAFDASCYIYSDDASFSNSLRGSNLRQRIRAIFEIGNELSGRDGKLIVTMREASRAPDPTIADSVVRELF